MIKKRLIQTRVMSALSVLACTSMLVAGCEGGTADSTAAPGASNSPAPQGGKPVELSIMLSPTGEAPKSDSLIKKEIERITGAKVNFTFVPRPAYPDKFSVMLASGDLPNAILALTPQEANVVNAIEAGAFWDIGPYLHEFPNLSKLNPKALDNAKTNGKNYGLIRSRGLGLHGLIIRKDWLDKLGLAEPKNPDELYKVLKEFTEKDPDGNGKPDTYGLVESKDLVSFVDVSLFFGAPNKWGIQDNKVVPAFETKEFMDTLQFFKRMYDEKLMNTNFALLNNQQKKDEMKKGKAGVFVGPMALMTNELIPGRVQKEAVLDVIHALDGPKGPRAISTPGFYGAYLFPKSTNKTEDDLRNALRFFDSLSSQEGMDLLYYGMKDEHYSVVDGKAVVNPEKAKAAQIEREFNHLAILPDSVTTPLQMTKEEEKVKQMEKANESIAVPDPVFSLVSKTYAEKGAELDKIINDAVVKFIMGQINKDGWNKAVQDWRQKGGDKMIQEYNEQIAGSKK